MADAGGLHGARPFGTTSEGNSLGVDERMELLEELADCDFDAGKLMPGTGSCLAGRCHCADAPRRRSRLRRRADAAALLLQGAQ